MTKRDGLRIDGAGQLFRCSLVALCKCVGELDQQPSYGEGEKQGATVPSPGQATEPATGQQAHFKILVPMPYPEG